jgi:hypothetical protein
VEAAVRPRTDRTVAGGPDWAWWIAVVALGALLLIGGVMLVRALPSLREPAWGFPGFQGLFSLSFGLMGALIVRRRRGNLVGWLMLATGLQAGLQLVSDMAPQIARIAEPGGSAFESWASWVSTWIWPPVVATIGLVLLVYPDGRLPSPRWRFALGLLALGTGLTCIGLAFSPGPLENFATVENPAGIAALPSGFLQAAWPVFLAGLIACGLAPIARWRDAPEIVRAQLKWLAFTGMPLMVAVAASVPSRPFSYVAIGFGVLVPVAVAVAVLRYRLYDIDHLISQTVLYGTLTAILAALYTASIRLFTILFSDLTGVSSEAPIVFSTLILAGAFSPVRRSLEKTVERRFKPSAATAEGSLLPVGSISVAELQTIIRDVVREELDRP